MDLETALKKVKKCLALSRSANEHEAAAALRQARALMDKFHLSAEGVLALGAGETKIKARYKSRAPRWDWILSQAAASQFDCEIIFEWSSAIGSRWVFVGEGSNPEVAAYAYEVLLRQLTQAKAAFLETELPVSLGLGLRRKLGARFALGWVSKISVALREYAGEERETSEAVKAYMKLRGEPKEKDFGKLKKAGNSLERYAMAAGVQRGAQVQLHRGLSPDSDQALIGHEQPVNL